MGQEAETDWAAVQRWYDDGHTRDECRELFGFSKRAWSAAVKRGDIAPRPPGTQVGERATRTKVSNLLSQGSTFAEAARELGIAKSTVAFHARRLGIQPDDRFSKHYDWAEIEKAHHAGMAVRECARTFGFHKGSWHKAVERGDIQPRDHRIPLEELLVVGRRTSRTHLKARLIDAGLKENRCEGCGLDEWRGKPLNPQLHHRNGDGRDNRIENLEFLCPNCHALTDTWGGRNGHRKPDGEAA